MQTEGSAHPASCSALRRDKQDFTVTYRKIRNPKSEPAGGC